MSIAASITYVGKLLGLGYGLRFGVRVKEILQLKLTLVGNIVFPEFRNRQRCHDELSRTILQVSFLRLKATIATAPRESEQ
jgi:hypothetical protein